MKRFLPYLSAAMSVLCGCSTTHVVDRASALAWGPEAVHRYAGSNVEVVLRDGRICEGTILRVDTQQVIQRDHARGVDTSIPLDSVLHIEGGSNAGWVVGGLLGGALAGGLIGGALGAGETEPVENDILGIGTATVAASNTASGGIVGAAIGGVLGGLIAGVATRTHDYTIVHVVPTPGRRGTTQGETGSKGGR